jgi:hypothetical protein
MRITNRRPSGGPITPLVQELLVVVAEGCGHDDDVLGIAVGDDAEHELAVDESARGRACPSTRTARAR